MLDLKKLKNLDRDDLLNLIGLETKRMPAEWILPTVGIFGLGFVVGAGLGLLLAPKPGRVFREEIRNRFQGAVDDLAERYEQPKVPSTTNQQPSSRPTTY